MELSCAILSCCTIPLSIESKNKSYVLQSAVTSFESGKDYEFIDWSITRPCTGHKPTRKCLTPSLEGFPNGPWSSISIGHSDHKAWSLQGLGSRADNALNRPSPITASWCRTEINGWPERHVTLLPLCNPNRVEEKTKQKNIYSYFPDRPAGVLLGADGLIWLGEAGLWFWVFWVWDTGLFWPWDGDAGFFTTDGVFWPCDGVFGLWDGFFWLSFFTYFLWSAL